MANEGKDRPFALKPQSLWVLHRMQDLHATVGIEMEKTKPSTMYLKKYLKEMVEHADKLDWLVGLDEDKDA